MKLVEKTVLGIKTGMEKAEAYTTQYSPCKLLPNLVPSICKLALIVGVTFMSGVIANAILFAIMIPMIVIAINTKEALQNAIKNKKISFDLVKSIINKDVVFYGALLISVPSMILGLVSISVVIVKHGIIDSVKHYQQKHAGKNNGKTCDSQTPTDEEDRTTTPGHSPKTDSNLLENFYARHPNKDTVQQLDTDKASEFFFQQQAIQKQRLEKLTKNATRTLTTAGGQSCN